MTHGAPRQLPVLPAGGHGEPARVPAGRRDRPQPRLLQCDICERYACADCLRVYDIYSGYDFLCHECARELERARLKVGGH